MWFNGRLFVLLVVYCYAAIAPLLLPVACLLYRGSYWVYKNNSLYVYVQTAESGGAVRDHLLFVYKKYCCFFEKSFAIYVRCYEYDGAKLFWF